MSEELKPCPHCGPMPAMPEIWRDHTGYVRVTCGPCGSSSGIRPPSDPDGEAKVISAWNRRALAHLEAEGLEVVPVEPTEAMVIAGGGSIIRPDVFMGGVPPGAKRRARDVWATMLAAAKPPQDDPDPPYTMKALSTPKAQE